MAENRAIGQNGGLPWRLPSDFAYFKNTTLGKPVIIGRRTFDTFNKPLPGRPHIIMTRNAGFIAPDGHHVAQDFDTACGIGARLLEEMGQNECMVVGGAEIYALALPKADRLYVSLVHCIPEADTFFPEFALSDWIEQSVQHQPKDDGDLHAWSLHIYERR